MKDDEENSGSIGDLLDGRETSHETDLGSYRTALDKSTNLSFDIEEEGKNYAVLDGKSGSLLLENEGNAQDATRIVYSQNEEILIDETVDSSIQASFHISQAFHEDYRS